MDEQDLIKRHTDCVYFLASPLTCKKGAECEYRHNEVARLNPRDCWYWFNATCLNPTCAFRHPPLDGHTGVPSEPTQSSLPTNKTTVPCYYFFNGFCNKGDRCSFSHGPDDSFYTVKPVKNVNGSTDALNLENKTSSGSKMGVASTPTEAHFDPSLTAPKGLPGIKLEPKERLQLPLSKNVKQQDDCPGISSPEYKEATVARADSLSPGECFVHSISHLCSDEQNSDEQVNSRIEPEEPWESSPGFDVLVQDGSENLDYEDGSEYLPVLDREHRELDEQYFGYEFKDHVEYATTSPEADIPYEQEMYDGYRSLDRDLMHADGRKVRSYSREIILDSILTRKRVHMPADWAACERNPDLRERLRRRREINDPPGKRVLGRDESLMVRNHERQHGYGTDYRLSRRLTSQLGFRNMESIRGVETLSVANRHRSFSHSEQHHRSRKHYREKLSKQQFLSPRKPVLKQRRSIHESTTFSGPKTLAEIKEEKERRKKKKTEGSFHRKSTSADFQDPKPLCEILKDKKSLDCVRYGNTCSN